MKKRFFQSPIINRQSTIRGSFPHHKHLAGVPDVKPFSGELRAVISEIDALVEANLTGE